MQGGPSIPSREGGDSEDVWGEFVEVEEETESRRKLDEQKKKLQKELRDVDRLSFVSKDVQESIKESLQHQLQEVKKREHQKVKKRSQKIQSIQDKKKILQKDSIAADEEMQKLQEEIRQKEEHIFFLSYKIFSRDCRQEEKEVAAMPRRNVSIRQRNSQRKNPRTFQAPV